MINHLCFGQFKVLLNLSYTIQEGLGALWTGIGPNVARNAIINAAELASYDQVKQVYNSLLKVASRNVGGFYSFVYFIFLLVFIFSLQLIHISLGADHT